MTTNHCPVCGIRCKGTCNGCLNLKNKIKKKCVACGYWLDYGRDDRYIKQGNYCQDCCGKAGKRAQINAGKMCMFDLKQLFNEQKMSFM